MKKGLLFVFGLIMTVLTFSGCSSDDVDPKSPEGIKKALVGVWKTSMGSSNWKTIYIMPNGNLKYGYVTKEKLEKYTYNKESGHYYYRWEDSNGYWMGIDYDPAPNAHWTFDENANSIYMHTDDGYYKFNYKVVMHDDQQSWVGTSSSGVMYTFTKIKE